MSEPAKVAYFSMEIALDPSIHTYSDGLGMPAGDALRSGCRYGRTDSGGHAGPSQRQLLAPMIPFLDYILSTRTERGQIGVPFCAGSGS